MSCVGCLCSFFVPFDTLTGQQQGILWSAGGRHFKAPVDLVWEESSRTGSAVVIGKFVHRDVSVSYVMGTNCLYPSLSFSSVWGKRSGPNSHFVHPLLLVVPFCFLVSQSPSLFYIVYHENVWKKIGQCDKISEHIFCNNVQNSVCNMKHVCNKGNVLEWLLLLSPSVFNNEYK